MASYFVASRARPDGIHPVHDRSRCPPEAFQRQGHEYLGEFLSASQALIVARLVYAGAGACPCCDPAGAALHAASPLASLRH